MPARGSLHQQERGVDHAPCIHTLVGTKGGGFPNPRRQFDAACERIQIPSRSSTRARKRERRIGEIERKFICSSTGDRRKMTVGRTSLHTRSVDPT